MKAKKGMTLIEIIVSMAIYAVIAMIIVNIMTSVNALMESTTQLDERLSYEAKYADNLLTSDDQGHDYTASVQRVNYEIMYDINASGNGKRINSSGSDRAAFEYTADYDDPNILGVNYHDNVNYRFMTFNKVPVSTPERESDTFTVIFRPVAYFSGKYGKAPGDTDYKAEMAKQFEDNMTATEKATATASAESLMSSGAFTSVKAEGTNFKSGSSAVLVDSTHNMVLDADFPVAVKHAPDAENMPSTTVKYPGTIKYTVEKNNTVYSSGTATYYMYVKYGSEATSVVYYNRVVIEYNVNTGALNPLKSES